MEEEEEESGEEDGVAVVALIGRKWVVGQWVSVW